MTTLHEHLPAPDGAMRGAPVPRVTVLTPTFNRRDFLVSTLASVRAQSYPDLEHIVLDGGSTDGTVEVLERARDLWGVRWVSEPDGGMYEALNNGLDLATGSVLGWINSDDWLLPWTVQSAVDEMGRQGRPCAVFGDVLSLTPGTTNARVQTYGHFSRKALGAGVTLAQPTVFWPRHAGLDAGPLDTLTYRQVADCEYWLRLSERLPFVKIREFLALVQDHPETKRVSLAADIDAELARLARQYRTAHSQLLARKVDSARRRWEWLNLLLERGWAVSLGSRALDVSWSSAGLAQRLLQFGPLRRHPWAGVTVSVAGLHAHLADLERELWGAGSTRVTSYSG